MSLMKQETVCKGCGLVFCAACELSALDFSAHHHGFMCLKCEEETQHKTTDKAAGKGGSSHKMANNRRTEGSGTCDPGTRNNASRNSAGQQNQAHHRVDADGELTSSHATTNASTDDRTCGTIFYSDCTSSNRRSTHGMEQGKREALQDVSSTRGNRIHDHQSSSVFSKYAPAGKLKTQGVSDLSSCGTTSASLRTFSNFSRADFDAFFSAVARTADNRIITAEHERRVYDLVAKQDSRLLHVYARFRSDLDMYAFGMALTSLVQNDAK
jgi:hypothetical protein